MPPNIIHHGQNSIIHRIGILFYTFSFRVLCPSNTPTVGLLIYLNINQLEGTKFHNEFISCFYMFRARAPNGHL